LSAFLFSKLFYFWIIPILFSALLAVVDFIYIFFPSRMSAYQSESLSLVLFIISIFWYAIIIYFHYILKKAITKNRLKSDQAKNYYEAQYLEKIERRRFIKYDRIIRDKEKYGARTLKADKKDTSWCDLFDNA
jgi:hypothetical protein